MAPKEILLAAEIADVRDGLLNALGTHQLTHRTGLLPTAGMPEPCCGPRERQQGYLTERHSLQMLKEHLGEPFVPYQLPSQ
jgi:hypothetical protein